MLLRLSYLWVFAIAVLLLLTALYFQYVLHLEPCPLCILQRIALAALGLAALAAAVHGRWNRFYAALVLLAALAGAALAGRHVWLQSLPPGQVPECGPGLGYMMQNFPLGDAMRMVLSGSGECAEVHPFLGMSIPGWTLLWFLIFTAFALTAFFARRR